MQKKKISTLGLKTDQLGNLFSLGADLPPHDADSTALHPQMSTLRGYEILEQLPHGGQALVFRAIHQATGMTVALKVLPYDQVDIPDARESFVREIALATKLDHPRIVRIRDSGLLNGQYFFAMEFIKGHHLDTYWKEHTLSLKEQVSLCEKICDAVTYAHQHGVMHRDLKPSNILIDTRGEPHVLDFGLAKSSQNKAELTNTMNGHTQTGQS